MKAANLYKSVQASGAVLCLGSALALPWQATSPYDAVERDLKMQNKPQTQSPTRSLYHGITCYATGRFENLTV